MRAIINTSIVFAAVILTSACGKKELSLNDKRGIWSVIEQKTKTLKSPNAIPKVTTSKYKLNFISATEVVMITDNSKDTLLWTIGDNNNFGKIVKMIKFTYKLNGFYKGYYDIVRFSATEEEWEDAGAFSGFMSDYITSFKVGLTKD